MGNFDRASGEGQRAGLLGDPSSDGAGGPTTRAGGSVRTLSCRTVAAGRLRQRNFIRDLQPHADGGGTDIATLLGDDVQPNPPEALLAALGSCLSIGIHGNAVARAIPIRRLEIEVEGDIDFTALWGTGDLAPSPLGCQAITIKVNVESDAARDVLQALVDYAALWSPVASTLHDPVHLDVVLA